MTVHKRLNILRVASAAVAVACMLAITSPAKALDSALDVEAKKIAEQVRNFLKDDGRDAVSIGQFTGPPQLDSTAGPGIAKAVTDALKEMGVTVKRRAELGVEGKFRDVKDAESKRLAAEISVQIVDRRGKVHDQFARGVFGDETLAALFGATAEIPPDSTGPERSDILEQALDNPSVHLDGTKISASEKSKFAIEILFKQGDEYVARPAVDEDGLAFVPLERNELYAVRLINNSDSDAGVKLTIDGISVFAFSENKDYERYVIPKGQAGLIKGWHINNLESEAFQVTEYSKSAAAELSKSGAEIGTITAVFCAAFPSDLPPPDEPAGPPPGAKSAGDATGRGPKVDAKFEEVTVEFGVARSTVSVRYARTK